MKLDETYFRDPTIQTDDELPQIVMEDSKDISEYENIFRIAYEKLRWPTDRGVQEYLVDSMLSNLKQVTEHSPLKFSESEESVQYEIGINYTTSPSVYTHLQIAYIIWTVFSKDFGNNELYRFDIVYTNEEGEDICVDLAYPLPFNKRKEFLTQYNHRTKQYNYIFNCTDKQASNVLRKFLCLTEEYIQDTGIIEDEVVLQFERFFGLSPVLSLTKGVYKEIPYSEITDDEVLSALNTISTQKMFKHYDENLQQSREIYNEEYQLVGYARIASISTKVRYTWINDLWKTLVSNVHPATKWFYGKKEYSSFGSTKPKHHIICGEIGYVYANDILYYVDLVININTAKAKDTWTKDLVKFTGMKDVDELQRYIDNQ